MCRPPGGRGVTASLADTPWWDYVEWYNRQAIWSRLLLYPLLVPVILVHGSAGIAFFFLGVLPRLLVTGWIENRRFWQTLRERGRLGRWPEVEPRVSSGCGTLVVEVGPQGPGCSWLIDRPRDEVDPDHVVPSWRDYEERGWDAFESDDAAFEALDRWSVDRLVTYESSAYGLLASWWRLARLGDDVKRASVLAVPCSCKGCLSGLYFER